MLELQWATIFDCGALQREAGALTRQQNHTLLVMYVQQTSDGEFTCGYVTSSHQMLYSIDINITKIDQLKAKNSRCGSDIKLRKTEQGKRNSCYLL